MSDDARSSTPEEPEGTPRDEHAAGEEEPRKPRSVRETLEAPGLRGQRPRPEGPSHGRRPHTSGPPLERGKAHPPSRPIPVREAMDAPPREIGPASPGELPSRVFASEGEEWVARVSGRTLAGVSPDAPAPLLHLTFYRSEAPDTPVREAVAAAGEIDQLPEEELVRCLARGRPAEGAGE